MKRKLSFFISMLALAGLIAVAFQSIDPAQMKSGATKLVDGVANAPVDPAQAPTLLKRLFSAEPAPRENPGPTVAPAPGREVIACTIGPEYASQPQIRVWAFRNGHKYGWIQLPKGTAVRLQRRDGDYLFVGYDEMTLKIHRAVAEAGLVVPVGRNGRLASL